MFELKPFKAKYFIGWIATSLPIGIVVANQDTATGSNKLLYSLLVTGIIFGYGLFGLGIHYVIVKFKKQPLLQREIFWWCYPIFFLILLTIIAISIGGSFMKH